MRSIPQTMLFTADGKPRCAVVYLAHLSEEERQFVVTLVFSKLVTWMRGQEGTPDLRALAYMDEVFGYVPPSASPPAKKPILTIFKQGRAFGLGLVLSTQNPVDLDYKAMSNAGTWLVGRLQTENDKARVLEGLRSAAGGTDVAALDKAIGALGKRQFLLVSAKSSTPRLLATRWAMSYLCGPLTKEQITRLRPADDSKLQSATSSTEPVAAVAAAGVAATPAPARAGPRRARRRRDGCRAARRCGHRRLVPRPGGPLGIGDRRSRRLEPSPRVPRRARLAQVRRQHRRRRRAAGVRGRLRAARRRCRPGERGAGRLRRARLRLGRAGERGLRPAERTRREGRLLRRRRRRRSGSALSSGARSSSSETASSSSSRARESLPTTSPPAATPPRRSAPTPRPRRSATASRRSATVSIARSRRRSGGSRSWRPTPARARRPSCSPAPARARRVLRRTSKHAVDGRCALERGVAARRVRAQRRTAGDREVQGRRDARTI